MCGKAFDGTSFIVSCSEDHSGLLQIIGGAHGVKSGGGKKHNHEHGNYDKSGDYQEAPDYNSMNPEYTLKGPFMSYSAANKNDYSSVNSPMENYSQKKNSSYQEAA